MNVNRRQFLRGSAVAVVTPLLPALPAFDAQPTGIIAGEFIPQGAAVSVNGNVARLLQRGLHDLMAQQYAALDVNFKGISLG